MANPNHPDKLGFEYGRKAYKTSAVCEQCGVMIRDAYKPIHHEWHERLRRAIDEGQPLE